MMMTPHYATSPDEFIATVSRAKEEAEQEQHQQEQKRKISGCLDPLTVDIISFEDEDDLEVEIHEIYRQLTRMIVVDSISTVVNRLRQLKGNIHLTRDDIITENGARGQQSVQ